MTKHILSIILLSCAYMLAGCAGNGHEQSVAEKQHNHAVEEHNHNEHGAELHAHEHEGAISLKPGEAEAIGLATEEVQPRKFTTVISCSGSVTGAAGDVITVVASQPGRVHYTHSWVEGEAVRAGADLFAISSRNVGAGDAAELARVAYETAKSEYDRMSSLVKDKIVSQREYEQARERYEQARLAYEAVGAGSQDGSQVAAAKGGYITRLWVKEGDYVEAGAPLATIAQNKRLQLRAEVPQRYYSYLSSITGAHFVTSYDDTLYELENMNGKLLSYGRNTGDGSYYIPVTFDFDNRGTLVPGTSVEVYLLGLPRENVLTLPVEALTEEQSLFFVYRMVCDNSFEKVEVQVGASDGSRVEILGGIKPGDHIVTHGVYRVKLAANSGIIPEGHSHNH